MPHATAKCVIFINSSSKFHMFSMVLVSQNVIWSTPCSVQWKGKRGRGKSWLNSLLPLQDREPPVGAEKVSRFGNLEKKEDLGRQSAKITSREGHKFHCQFQIEYLNPICWWEAANLASSSSWWWFSSYCLSLRWEGWRWGGWGRRR